MKDWANEVISSSKRVAIPIMTHPGIEMIGKRIVDAVRDGKTHAEAIIALNAKYPAAASTVIMDLTVEAEAFGCEIEFIDDDMPNVLGRLVSNMAEVEALQIPSLSAGRVPEYIEANRIVAQSITDKPTFGGIIGPFSLAGRLFDMTEIMMALYIEPETIKLLLEKCTEFIISYAKALKDSGVSGVIMAEPAAGLLSNDDSLSYSTHYVKRIVDAVQDDSFMVVFHNCGNGGHSTDSMVKTGAAALHFGNMIDMVTALNETPRELLVMGNLDPVSIIKQSSADEVAEATKRLLEATAQYSNFILSTGCDVPPAVPEDNIKAFYSVL